MLERSIEDRIGPIYVESLDGAADEGGAAVAAVGSVADEAIADEPTSAGDAVPPSPMDDADTPAVDSPAADARSSETDPLGVASVEQMSGDEAPSPSK